MSRIFKIVISLSVPAIAAAILVASHDGALAAQDKWSLKAPNGVGFSEFKGYEDWQTVAVSQVDGGIKTILANPAMIAAYRKGVPAKDTAFPEGSKIVKIEWAPKKNAESPYFVMVPDTLRSVSFIEKDSKRFPDTNGWGYAQFQYDATTKTFTPFGKDASFNKQVCHACHIAVKAKDYIFTGYPLR